MHQRYRQDRQDRTDRQTDRQRSDSIGRTVLQTVAQKATSHSSGNGQNSSPRALVAADTTEQILMKLGIYHVCKCRCDNADGIGEHA